MREITARHTGAMLARNRDFIPKQNIDVDPNKVAERRLLLQEKGLLVQLDSGIPCPLYLPGNVEGMGTGITQEGFVVVQGWVDPFNPRSVKKREPSGK